MKRTRHLALLAVVVLTSVAVVYAAGLTGEAKIGRDQAIKLHKDGNYKEAYEAFAALALDPGDDPMKVGQDLHHGVYCLERLGKHKDIDPFLEKVIKTHSENWRLLWAAAQSYMRTRHSGYIIAGEFQRGRHRGGGQYVNAYERDRARALQLMVQATGKLKRGDGASAGRLHWELAEMLMGGRGFNAAWRLQYLTDLSKLPDWDDPQYYGGRRGAPVDKQGNPVYHRLPKSWEAAKTDGERWRFALMQAVEFDGNLDSQVKYHFASFLHHQFGVQTMREYGFFFRHPPQSDRDDDTRKDEAGTWELHTLREDETIAKLATGIKRFKVPEEFNFVRVFQQVAGAAGSHRQNALVQLAQIFQNRRQYDKAVDYWTRSKIQDWQKRVSQIVDPWGRFDSIGTQPGRKGASVEFVYRNGSEVQLTAYPIKVRKLLDDVKAYLKKLPPKLDWKHLRIENIGYRLVVENQKQYIGEKGPDWKLNLKPRDKHFDRRITISTPLQEAGAYLLTAKMKGGNTSRIVIWVADTAIVKKPVDGKDFYFVADAVTGKPVPKANLEFFGYRQEYIRQARGRGHYKTHFRNFAEFTDAKGQLLLAKKADNDRYQYVIVATTPRGRLAYMGFTRLWFSRRHDSAYKATKTFVMTDRPVYRPKHTVKFKFWVNHAQYDQEGASAFAGKTFKVQVNNPKGEKLFRKEYKADAFGGFDGEFTLPKDATLGVYQIFWGEEGMRTVWRDGQRKKEPYFYSRGGNSFRVEEYKKPEFEVTVEAPKEPVMLGEKITATIKAKYYFGAPVTEAKVKVKVLRTPHTEEWYPIGRWDWFYGKGYWWFAGDYPWYPGWREWGCRAPRPWWHWRWRRHQPPEVVAEDVVQIGKDGTATITIDTALAKAMHGDQDHKYEVTAEVTDLSRRTIVGKGNILVARKPFRVFSWVHRGHYRVGDTIHANFQARRLDGKPVKGKGVLRLLKIRYDKDLKPVEDPVGKWDLDTNDEGRALYHQLKASAAGQYRLSYTVSDEKGHKIEGAYLFVIRGEGFDGNRYRFNDIELVTDKREYKPGEKVELMVNTNRPASTVLLFVRPSGGVYLPPKMLTLRGQSVVELVEVVKKDMPNFFVEAITVSGGRVHSQVREVIVPPESRVLDVKVTPSAKEYKPGQKNATVKVKLTDASGEPFKGSAVVSIYDKSVEYIAGGSNVPEIKAFFWKWRRRHSPRTASSLGKGSGNLLKKNEIGMGHLGVFGHLVADEMDRLDESGVGGGGEDKDRARHRAKAGYAGAVEGEESLAAAAPGGRANGLARKRASLAEGPGQPAAVQPTVRTKFADTALWVGSLTTNERGVATVKLDMPENLTTWKTRVWAMGNGTRCGEGAAEVVTTKNLVLRLQAPRFFVQKDEVVLSANVHNYLKTRKQVQVVLELEGGTLEPMAKDLTQTVTIEPKGEKRVDWRVKVVEPGAAVVRMKALTDEESDAMQMSFPVKVHGMLKTESFSGALRPQDKHGTIEIRVPAERRPKESRLEIRYSPTLAMAMVDALPYLASYPYGCTEQTLNRFLPAVITQKVLLRMGLDLKAIQEKRTNLNAQEIGKDVERAKQWKRFEDNPVFDQALLTDMVKAGVEKLTSMQNGDGGWGWFSGWRERSWPHTTAVVVHGLQIARANDVALVPNMLAKGIGWLQRYQAKQVRLLRNAVANKDLPEGKRHKHYKTHADNLDAFIYMVLVDEKSDHKAMKDFLYRDRNHLAVYAKAMFGLALHKVGDMKKRDMLIRNVSQFVVEDAENQTAYLDLPNGGYWWRWYGSEYEAHAYYLKLLCVTDPKGRLASRMVKYLLNNRKHATYWKSTRDTALVVEAFADYLKASGEDKPDLTVQILLDGKQVKQVKIDRQNLFTYDNKLMLVGKQVKTGKHTITIKKVGSGPLYFNAYLTNFTLEDPITKAGLEIKVQRKYYKLVRVEKTIKVEDVRGSARDQKVEKYERKPLANLDTVKSGDLIEIELEIASKNDYEYILFEDMKAAGCEPYRVRSGYGGRGLGAYMELRDDRITFFVRRLARGKHSIAYRMRAEIPGKFSALPTTASAMYAPELKANSDEIKIQIED